MKKIFFEKAFSCDGSGRERDPNNHGCACTGSCYVPDVWREKVDMLCSYLNKEMYDKGFRVRAVYGNDGKIKDFGIFIV